MKIRYLLISLAIIIFILKISGLVEYLPYKNDLEILYKRLVASYTLHQSLPDFEKYQIIKEKNNTVPKIIHFVWVGSKELPDDVKTTIETWKKYAPDYQIKRWSEDECEISSNKNIMLLYENKAYQYVSDWCRFKALKKEGGVYLDTDHHLTKSFDELVNSELTVVMQDHNTLSASFISSIPNHPIFDDILEDKKWNYTIASPFRVAGAIKKHFGISEYKRKPLQSAKLNIYPPNFFMNNYGGNENRAIHLYGDGKITYSKNMPWYDFYFKSNLANYFYHLDNMILIPNDENFYYDFHSKKNFVLEESGNNIIRIKPINDKTFTYYLCEYNICYNIPFSSPN